MASVAVAMVRKGGQEGFLQAESTSWDMAHIIPKEQECVTGGRGGTLGDALHRSAAKPGAGLSDSLVSRQLHRQPAVVQGPHSPSLSFPWQHMKALASWGALRMRLSSFVEVEIGGLFQRRGILEADAWSPGLHVHYPSQHSHSSEPG